MVNRCGAYADHVDHIVPLSAWPAYRRNGSTSRWRRLRLLVLDRDAWRCQLPVDAAGDLAPEQPAERPAHPDDPRNLRAACALHNLQRGDGNRRPANDDRPAAAGRWEW